MQKNGRVARATPCHLLPISLSNIHLEFRRLFSTLPSLLADSLILG